MAKYRKKTEVIEATQWFKNGDHPKDNQYLVEPRDGESFMSEGEVVRYYRTPDMDGQNKCVVCGKIMHLHGWIDVGKNGHVVCPGDWILTDVQGKHHPCKPVLFEKTYELVKE